MSNKICSGGQNTWKNGRPETKIQNLIYLTNPINQHERTSQSPSQNVLTSVRFFGVLQAHAQSGGNLPVLQVTCKTFRDVR